MQALELRAGKLREAVAALSRELAACEQARAGVAQGVAWLLEPELPTGVRHSRSTALSGRVWDKADVS